MSPALDRDRSTAIVIDLGNTGVKIGIATLTGAILWHISRTLDTELVPGGGAIQDAELWWQIILEGLDEGLGAPGIDRAAIAAVGITGQWASTVPVDETGHPVGPCLLFFDSRGAPEAQRRVGGPVEGYAPSKLFTWVTHSGGAPALDGADPLGHRWYLQTQEPALYHRARWLMEPVDYLGMRFTGVAAATPVPTASPDGQPASSSPE